jgi:DNA-binding NarL/FixJ family response regulator
LEENSQLLENTKEAPADPNSKILELAFSFIEFTNCNLFVTGKAGSGKTFFLREQSKRTSKNHVILAPTGIAAVNANGVTINSLFQIPPGLFLNSQVQPKEANVYLISDVLRNLNYTTAKKEFIRKLELIFIDEVSMLRSDQVAVMDAILKKLRNNKRPFGGVQLILIGDLFQLPPIVSNDISAIFLKNYKSEFFFDAEVLQSNPLIQLELPYVHRQSDSRFIDLLNKVRMNQLTDADLQYLNKRVTETSEDSAFVISITSHNEETNEINKQKLNDINGEVKEFHAIISGDYKDAYLTAEKILRLKKGALVMLIRNDSNSLKQYYNGKLAVVVEMKENSVVIQFEEGNEIEITQSTWETYDYKAESGMIEVTGQLKQLPLRLAWAVTIHKSQGLTFEHADIDAAKSFAPGQVYVALSRVKSYEGIRLRTRLTRRAILTNSHIVSYLKSISPDELTSELSKGKISYWLYLVIDKFNLDAQLKLLSEILNKPDTHKQKIEVHALLAFQDHFKVLEELQTVFNKFSAEINAKFSNGIDGALLTERTGKAEIYFIDKIDKSHLALNDLWSNLSNKESITANTTRLIKDSFSDRMIEIREVSQLIEAYFFKGIDEAIKMSRKTPYTIPSGTNVEHKVGAATEEKISKSQQLTIDQLKAGKTIAEISEARKLSHSTIENHLLEAAKAGETVSPLIMNQTDIIALQNYIHEVGIDILDLKEKVGEEYSFFQLRLILSEHR